MTIAVHMYFAGPRADPTTNYNYRSFILIAAKCPSDHFIFIFDRPFDPSLIQHTNITPVLLLPQIKNRLLQHYWYNYKLPRLLKKYGVDIFISGDCVCSLRVKTRQLMLVHNLSFLQKNSQYSAADKQYLKKYFKAFMKRADRIIVSNKYLQNQLATLLPETEIKTSTIKSGSNKPFKSYSENEITGLKEKLTRGKEYFLFVGTGSGISSQLMLKSFSVFKKWQKSNLNLVVLMHKQKGDDVKNISSYKYRDDVKLIFAEEEENPDLIVAGAYAVISLPTVENTEADLIVSSHNNAPLIITDHAFYQHVYEDGALYTSLNEKELSEVMMRVYKDENLRNDIIQKRGVLSEKYTWLHAADSLWDMIQSTV